MAVEKVTREPDEFLSPSINQTLQLLLEVAEGGCDPCLTVRYCDNEAKQYELDVARINEISSGALLGWMVKQSANKHKWKLAARPGPREFVPVEVFGSTASIIAGSILSDEEAVQVIRSAFAGCSQFADLNFLDFLENFVPT